LGQREGRRERQHSEGRKLHIGILAWYHLARVRLVTLISLLAACSFDRGALDELRCRSNDDCAPGIYCRDGYCLALDRNQDAAVPDMTPQPDAEICRDPDDEDEDGLTCDDLCPGLSSPDNTDNDGDGAGNPCDCQREDAAFAATLIDDLFNEDAGLLTGVVGIWQFVSGFYQQLQDNGVTLSWIADANSEDFSINTSLFVRQNGSAGLGHNAAGVIFRAQNLTPSAGTAYLCGVNLATPRRAWLAVMDFGAGTVTELDSISLPFNPPAANWPDPHFIRLVAIGDEISCTVCDGTVTPLCSSGAVTATATDATHTEGTVGFFTFGTEADFNFMKACGDPP